MGKETVRYPDALVARIEDLVADSAVFESKSELHRFASDFFLSVLDPDHDPSVLGYSDILEDLEVESGVSLQPDDVATTESNVSFLESYLRVRRSLLHGKVEEAQAYVEETYDITDREALLLDELIGQHRSESTDPHAGPVRGGHPVSEPRRPARNEPDRNGHAPDSESPEPEPDGREQESTASTTDEADDEETGPKGLPSESESDPRSPETSY